MKEYIERNGFKRHVPKLLPERRERGCAECFSAFIACPSPEPERRSACCLFCLLNHEALHHEGDGNLKDVLLRKYFGNQYRQSMCCIRVGDALYQGVRRKVRRRSKAKMRL